MALIEFCRLEAKYSEAARNLVLSSFNNIIDVTTRGDASLAKEVYSVAGGLLNGEERRIEWQTLHRDYFTDYPDGSIPLEDSGNNKSWYIIIE